MTTEKVSYSIGQLAIGGCYLVIALSVYLQNKPEMDVFIQRHIDHLKGELTLSLKRNLVSLPKNGRLWIEVAQAVSDGVRHCRQWASC